MNILNYIKQYCKKQYKNDRKSNQRDKATKERMTEIRLHLDSIKNPTIIADMYVLYRQIVFEEEKRTSVLDSKASTHLGLIAIAVTIFLTLGGMLIKDIVNIRLPGLGCPTPLLVIFYLLSFFFFCASFVISIFAYKVTSFSWIADKAILFENVKKIKKSLYKKMMIVHFWEIYRKNRQVNERKATRLKCAQMCCLLAVILFIPIIIILSWYILSL